MDWGRAPPFELVEKAAVADEFAALRATKRGGCVTVSVRRVRNKNCTFVDGLDGWGFDEARQKAVAAALRTKFSAAASVAGEKRHRGQPQGPCSSRSWSRRTPSRSATSSGGFRRLKAVGAGEEGPGDEEGPAGVLGAPGRWYLVERTRRRSLAHFFTSVWRAGRSRTRGGRGAG